MAAKLFIGNLEYSVSSDDLRDYFSSVGSVVDAVVIMDKMSGRSRGFGFVEYATEAEAQDAIKKLNNTELKGRAINVNEARSKEEGSAPTASMPSVADVEDTDDAEEEAELTQE